MKKVLKALTDHEVLLLTELKQNLLTMDYEDAQAAAKRIDHLVKNRSFGQHKELHESLLATTGEYYGRSGQLNKATMIFEQLVLCARKNRHKQMEYKALANLAVCNAQMGKFLDALETWQKILKKSKEIEHRIHLLNNISAAYGFIGETSLSQQYAFEAMKLAEENKLEELKISPLINIGTAYEKESLHQKALDNWHIALDLSRKYNLQHSLKNVLGNMALAYNALGETDLALKYEHESLKVREDHAIPAEMAAPLNNIGFIHETAGELELALEYYEKAMQMYRQTNETASMANCLANFGSIYIKKQDYPTALSYLKEALETANMTESEPVKIRITRMLADAYAYLGDYQNAYIHVRDSADKSSEHEKKVKSNTISINEANYYKRRIELQKEAYRRQNKELKKKNKIIHEATTELQTRNAALQDTLEVLNWLVSVISHDVRAPLGNFTRVITMMQDGSIAEDQHAELLDNLRKSSENVYKLVDEMLDGIRLQRRKMDVNVNMRKQNLVPILMSIFAIYLPISTHKRVDLNYEFSAEDIEAVIDADLFKIVIRNLLNNALKFTDAKGEVKITVAQIGENVELCVVDNGRGMDQNTLQRLRDGLSNSESEESAHQDGIGLGLVLCRKAMLSMNSSMEIDSSPEKGTRIKMVFSA